MVGALMRMLNYEVINGCFITPGKVVAHKFGSDAKVTCEWEEDTKRAIHAIEASDKATLSLVGVAIKPWELNDEANTSKSSDEADSSVTSTDTEVRETVLREDV